MPKLISPYAENIPAGHFMEVGPRGHLVDNARHATLHTCGSLPRTSEPGNKWQRISYAAAGLSVGLLVH